MDLARCLSRGASRNEKWKVRAHRVLVPCRSLELYFCFTPNKLEQKLEGFPVKFSLCVGIRVATTMPAYIASCLIFL